MTVEVDSKTLAETLIENIGKVIVGKSETVELALVALISGGHVLIEDVPGVVTRRPSNRISPRWRPGRSHGWQSSTHAKRT